MMARFSFVSLVVLAVCTLMLCSGCANFQGPSKDEYKAIFSQVIRKSFDVTATNNVCLPQTFGFVLPGRDVIEISADGDIGTNPFVMNQLSQLKALEAVGLLTGVASERTQNGKPQKILTFSRTDKGNSAFSNGTFCYARAEFDSVVKWKGPFKLGDYQVAWVYYTTKTAQMADWVRSAAILAAFPAIAPIVNGGPPKVRQVAIDLSSEGWDVAEYSKLLQLQ